MASSTSQGPDVAARGRDRSSAREPNKKSSLRKKNRSTTRGSRKQQQGTTSSNPIDDLTPLKSQESDDECNRFLQDMEARKDTEWLDIKEPNPVRFMAYVPKRFKQVTSHSLKGLSEYTDWIQAKGYYHWKVVELKQLKHCPHLKGLPVPQDTWLVPVTSNRPRSLTNPRPQLLVPLDRTEAMNGYFINW